MCSFFRKQIELSLAKSPKFAILLNISMKLYKSPERFSSPLRAADVLKPPSSEPTFSLDKYITAEDRELVEQLIEWIFNKPLWDAGLKRARIKALVKWIEVADPGQLEPLVQNAVLQLFVKTSLRGPVNGKDVSKQQFLQFLQPTFSGSVTFSSELNFLEKLSSTDTLDMALMEVVDAYPEKLSEILQLMDRKEYWAALFAELKKALAREWTFDRAIKIGATIVILNPERKQEVQALIKPVENQFLRRSENSAQNMLQRLQNDNSRPLVTRREEGQVNREEVESIIFNYLMPRADLCIINAEQVSLTPEGFIQIGSKKQLDASHTLPDRLLA